MLANKKLFEQEIASINQAYFFREFTYSNSKFRYRSQKSEENEVELADSILWLRRNLIAYQLKERNNQEATTQQKEREWFEKKVLRKGTKQIRDTIQYLNSQSNIPLENHRGHKFNLSLSTIDKMHKLVVFKPMGDFPKMLFPEKFHESTTAGIIHIIHAEDYIGLIKTLLTPAEFMDYLIHREQLIMKWKNKINSLPEQALLGHYVAGDMEDQPKVSHAYHLVDIDHRIEQWDISGIISLFSDRITFAEKPTDYYEVITALAELKRNELEAFKERFLLARSKAKANVYAKPYRVAYPRLNLGFIFIPLTDEFIAFRGEALKNLTLAHKYDQRLQKCIGISFAIDGAEHYNIEWCLIESAWKHNKEFEDFISKNSPFRELKSIELPRYSI